MIIRRPGSAHPAQARSRAQRKGLLCYGHRGKVLHRPGRIGDPLTLVLPRLASVRSNGGATCCSRWDRVLSQHGASAAASSGARGCGTAVRSHRAEATLEHYAAGDLALFQTVLVGTCCSAKRVPLHVFGGLQMVSWLPAARTDHGRHSIGTTLL